MIPQTFCPGFNHYATPTPLYRVLFLITVFNFYRPLVIDLLNSRLIFFLISFAPMYLRTKGLKCEYVICQESVISVLLIVDSRLLNL
jgi:hypothetical protein